MTYTRRHGRVLLPRCLPLLGQDDLRHGRAPGRHIVLPVAHRPSEPPYRHRVPVRGAFTYRKFYCGYGTHRRRAKSTIMP